MNDLPPDALEVLNAARGWNEPTAADRARVRRALTATLLASAAGAAAGSAKAATSSAMTTGSSVIVTVKTVGIATALAVAGSAAWWQLAKDEGPSAVAAVEQTAVAPANHPSRDDIPEVEALDPKPGAARATGAIAEAREVAEEAQADEPERAATEDEASEVIADVDLGSEPQRGTAVRPADATSTVRARANAPSARTGGSGATSRSGITWSTSTSTTTGARRAPTQADPVTRSVAPQAKEQAVARTRSEVELIDEASRALGRGDASGALALLKEHRAQYPRGVLAHERHGLTVIALCGLGSPGAARSGQRFLDQSPRSPLAKRVRAACDVDRE